jgi:hypothetical protein
MNESNQRNSDMPNAAEHLSFPQRQVLERALAKVVLLGEQVGVTIDEMILLLGSGLTVGELIEYLAERRGERC